MKHLKLFVKSVGYSFRLIFRSSKGLILLYVAADMLCTIFPLISAFLFKGFLDAVVVAAPNLNRIGLYIGLYMVSLVLTHAVESSKNILHDSLFKKAEFLYDCDLLEKLAALPLSVIDTSEGKDMIDDVRYTKNAAVYLAYRIVRVFSLMYAFCIAMGTLMAFNICFSLLFMVLTIPGILLNVLFERKTEALRLKTAPDVRRFCYYRWMLTDNWPAKDVRMYDLTEPIKERYGDEKQEYLKKNRRLDQKETAASLLAEWIMRSGEIIFTVFVVWRALMGEITIGDVSLYIGFAISATSSFQIMTSIVVMGFTRTTKIMERLFAFLDRESSGECSQKRKLEHFDSLVFDNVYFKYPLTDKYVLCGVSFTLNSGDKLSIIGINGSGKSTIIKLMLGLYEVNSGRILINGYPMSDYDVADVRGLFSVLFQNFVQFPLTLRDNIALSDYRRAANDEDIISSLKQSGLYDELKKKDGFGLDSPMTRRFDDNGVELSKGQWQKVALSRAYFKNASIIIFDEPSSALDAQAEDRIFKTFETVSDRRTGILISHRISSARLSNKIIVLDNGKISESGTHGELVAHNGLYAKLYRLQKEKYVVAEAVE